MERLRAAILSPGPSLSKTIPKSWKTFGQIIAVTDAIFADAPFTSWTFQEGPGHPNQNRYKRYCERFTALKIPVWCVKGSADRWTNHWTLDKTLVLDEFSILDLLDQLPYKTKHWRSRRKGGVQPYGGSSMFYSLARAMVNGATDIHVYGSDFDGCGNVDPRTGEIAFNRRVEEWWKDRWEYEKNLLLNLQEETAKHGISITIYTAEYKLPAMAVEIGSTNDGWL